MKRFFHDLFFPHLHNNFRSRILHHQTLIFAILFLLASSFVLSFARTTFPQVLGIATDVTSEQLLIYTNDERAQNGAGPLNLDGKLSEAASAKARDMFSENYWAHNSPSGKTPWLFIKDTGYTYTYAGENLAKGFTDTQDVIKAWMASPSHRENMLSKNYEDVGFAVKEGKLEGEDTILIVEMFGNTTLAQNTLGKAQAPITKSLILNSQTNNPLIDVTLISKNFTIILSLFFILVLLLDMIIVGRQNVVRFVGHNIDHIFFFSVILLLILIIARGSIL